MEQREQPRARKLLLLINDDSGECIEENANAPRIILSEGFDIDRDAHVFNKYAPPHESLVAR